MSRIVLGKSANKNVELGVGILLRTHLLIWASTGGGKSWLIRRLAEQLFGKVPVIIVDREGEFSTLREKFGFVLVGQGGETPADVRSAKLVAEKLLELRASAVCDLYELKHETRHEWVKAFVSGLVDAPKRLWGPTVVVIDEAHLFCPEKGQGESPAYGAVADLAGQGRKRGFGIVLATQRLSKLSKNATGEMYNHAAGPTARQADRDRAAYEMGISERKEIQEFSETLRRLECGTFFFQGRAIAMDRLLVNVGPVETTHPEAGSTKFKSGPPPAPEEIRALLPKLADLPKAAEEKAKTESELRAEIRSLKAQLRAQPVKTETKTIQVVDQKAIERAVRTVEQQTQKQFVAIHVSRKKLMANGAHFARALVQLAEAARKAFIAEVAEDQHAAVPVRLTINREEFLKKEAGAIRTRVTNERPVSLPPDRDGLTRPTSRSELDGEVKGTPLKVLRALADFEALGRVEVARPTLASWCGVKHTTGTFSNYLSELRTRGLIEDSPDRTRLRLTDAGRGVAGPAQAPITTDEMLGRCLAIMKGTPAKMLKVLHNHYPEYLSYEDLGQSLDPPISGDTGTFSNYISALNVAEMIVKGPNRTVRCADWLFID
jgi:hypothetical protein